jgi:hypothetical protein
MGWASQENGELLALASGKFDVFITTDQRLSYQQAVSNFAIAVRPQPLPVWNFS